jgi:hypothetical protein
MGNKNKNEDHEERCEERCERHRNIRRRVRYFPLNLQGEQHQLPTLLQGTLLVFSRDGAIYPKRHMDLFLDICDFYLREYDVVMV